MPSSRLELRQWLVYTAHSPENFASELSCLKSSPETFQLDISLANVKYLSTQRSRMLLGAFKMNYESGF